MFLNICYRVQRQKIWHVKVNPCIFADNSSWCQNISVVLKNKVFEAQNQARDTYQLSKLVNGKASWISKYQAIWYISKFKFWAVGDFIKIGNTSTRIYSKRDEFPYEIPSDQFLYSDAGKWKKPGANDISIDCIDGKGISFYSICFTQLCFRKLQ